MKKSFFNLKSLSMNLSLFIDAIDCETIIFLFENNNLIAQKKYLNEQNLSNNLMNYITNLVHEYNLKLSDIKNIYTICSPGKFSAMRISAITLKTINYINKTNLFIIDRFHFLNEKNCICLIKTDGNKFFKCEFINNKLVNDQILLIDNEQYEHLIKTSKQKIISDANPITFEQLIKKLHEFKKVDYNFVLNYHKPAC